MRFCAMWVLLCAALANHARAIPIPVNGSWVEIDELMTAGSFYSPIFTYTTDLPQVRLDVTDFLVLSDRNEVYLNGVSIGATPAMPDWPTYTVDPYDPDFYKADPEDAWNSPEYSKASFWLPGSGTHMLTFRNLHIPPNLAQTGPLADGTVAFRLVPEPGTLGFALIGAAALLLGRRRIVRASPAVVSCLALGVALMAPPDASAQPSFQSHSAQQAADPPFSLSAADPQVLGSGSCGASVSAAVSGAILEITGTDNADSVRVHYDSVADSLDVYTPVGAGAPTFSFDPGSFDTIRALLCDGDDLLVFDDSGGEIAMTWRLHVEAGEGQNIVIGGLDLSTISLGDALDLLDTLEQARDLIDAALDLLDSYDDDPNQCASADCLVLSAADLAREATEELIIPTAQYVRDIESELIQPLAQAIQDTLDRVDAFVETFVADEALGLTADVWQMQADVEEFSLDFEELFPMAQALLNRAEDLYQRAENLGLETQPGNGLAVFEETIRNHTISIEMISELCDEDPEPTETDFDEDDQVPEGLSTWCAELERRIEALEAITDDVGDDENPNSKAAQLEAELDAFEADGDALEALGDALGDDENPGSHAAVMEAMGDALVDRGDALSASADALNEDWENWVGQLESDMESAGEGMNMRGQTEILGAAEALEQRAQQTVLAAAERLRSEAQQIMDDLDALMAAAEPLLGDGPSLARRDDENPCEIETEHFISGGSGSNILVGTSGNDHIVGGSGNDLILGRGGDDLIFGGEGSDLIFGGGGNDVIYGGPGVDILVGNRGDDCIFGGGGQTISRGSFSVELGDIFIGGPGNDRIYSGDDEEDRPTEIDFVWGGSGDDLIRSGHGSTLTIGSFSLQLGDLVFGQDGNDDILTGDGIDVVFGGDGNDRIQTGKGAALELGGFRLALGDLIFGGDGDDEIDADDPDGDREDDDIDIIFGGGGNDTIRAYGGGMLSIGNVNNPAFELHLGNLVFGGDGDDKITAMDGIDVLFGGDGDDEIHAGRGSLLKLGGGSGSSSFRLALGDLIFGGEDDDEIHGDDPKEEDEDDDPNSPGDPNDPNAPGGPTDDDYDIDVIFGGGGNDKIYGYGGGLLSIGDPNDPSFEIRLGNVIFGGDGDDEIITLEGIDLIFAGDGDDTVEAGKGDTLEIGEAFSMQLGDLIFGGEGNDTLHGDAAEGPEDRDELDGVDLIFGGPGDDRIFGGGGGKIELPKQDFCLLFGNLLFGGPGNDHLRGDYEDWDEENPRGGLDLIFGGDGNDTIEGGGGTLIVIGDITTAQAILIWFGNLLFGGEGDDVIRGGNNAELCSGQNETLDNLLNSLGVSDLGGAADLIFCGPGDDEVDAYNGIDFIFGGDGDDFLRADHGGILIVPISGVPAPIAMGNLIFGADGEDTIRSKGRLITPAIPPMEIDLLFGGPCDDDISAGDGINLVFGNRANDIITAGDGFNLLFGNRGDDEIIAGSGLNLIFGNRGDDDLTAGSGLNIVFGNRGDDIIVAGSGLNIIFGNRDNDHITVGDGLNIVFGNRDDDEIETGDGLNLVFGNRGSDHLKAGKGLHLLFGGTGDDFIESGSGPVNTSNGNAVAGLTLAFGGRGHDVLNAGSGLGLLFGGQGDDRLRSGGGLNLLFGGAGRDVLVGGGVGLMLAFGGAGDDVIVGGVGLNLAFGNAGNDQFFGGSGVNFFFGNRGDDVIRGGGGPDFLFGNAGNDKIDGGNGLDFIFGNKGNDELASGDGKDFVFGNRGNDLVYSSDSSGCDLLFGNRGDDHLDKCQSCDKSFGGRGNDTKTEDCLSITMPAPNHGEVRGRVWIDLDGDGIGDEPHVGVTVTAGSFSTITDDDGRFRIAMLQAGTNYTVSQTVPAGYVQSSTPINYSATIGSQGINLHLDLDFVNVERCFVSGDSWGCVGFSCGAAQNPPIEAECLPVAVRPALRCEATGELCDDCPCGGCIPSWEVVECECNPHCYIELDPANGPQCAGMCENGGSCELMYDGDVYRCGGCFDDPNEPCQITSFTFQASVTEVFGCPPFPVQPGSVMEYTYWFDRFAPDIASSPVTGTYQNLLCYEFRVDGVIVASGSPVGEGNVIIVRDDSGGQTGRMDQYEVRLRTSPVPNTEIYLSLLDVTMNAINSDLLLLCGDLILSSYGGPNRLQYGTPSPACPGFRIVSTAIFEHDCLECSTCPALPTTDWRQGEAAVTPE